MNFMATTIQSFPFNPFSENTYIIFNENKNAFLVDPGNYNEKETKMLEYFIEENQLKIQNVLLTHAHIDHVFGLQWAFDQYKVPVLMHEDDQEILDRNPISARSYGFFFKLFEGEIKFINEDEVLKLDGDEFKIYHIPGHSPGSIAFHNEKQNYVVSGDVLFQGSIGRTDLYKGDYQQLIDGIKTKLFPLHDETEVFSGHGNPTNIGFEKQFNPFLR